MTIAPGSITADQFMTLSEKCDVRLSPAGLHSDYFYICLLDVDGEEVARAQINKEALGTYFVYIGSKF